MEDAARAAEIARRWRRIVLKEAIRALGSCAASVGLGVASGWAGAVGGAARGEPALGAFVGGMMGLVLAYAMVFALERGVWVLGVGVIGMATVSAAWAAAHTPAGGMACLIGAGAVHVGMCVGYGITMRRTYPSPRRGVCAECGYSRRGLPEGVVCPECGTAPVE